MHDLFVVASLCRILTLKVAKTLQVYGTVKHIYIYTVIFSDVFFFYTMLIFFFHCGCMRAYYEYETTQSLFFFSRLTLKLGDPDQYKRTISPWYNYIIIPIYILYIRQESSRLRAPALIQPYFHFWFIVCTFHAVGTSAVQSSTNFVTCSMLCFFRHTYCVISLF